MDAFLKVVNRLERLWMFFLNGREDLGITSNGSRVVFGMQASASVLVIIVLPRALCARVRWREVFHTLELAMGGWVGFFLAKKRSSMRASLRRQMLGNGFLGMAVNRLERRWTHF